MYTTKRIRVYYVLGALLFITGLIVTSFSTIVFQKILSNQLKLLPNTMLYKVWKHPPMDLNIDFYMYNWTNSEHFRNASSVKPMVQQLGPYRFKEKLDKINVTWNTNNSTVTYRRLSSVYFDAEGSKGSLDDLITNLNPIAVGASDKFRFSGFFRLKAIAIGLAYHGSKTTVTKTVGDLLYDGYDDSLVTMSRAFPSLAGESSPMDRVGWFYTRNGSAEITGWFNVNTGEKDVSRLGALQNWNFDNTSRNYDGECATFRGSGGEFFPPNQQRGRISIFVPDMCKDVPLDYESDVVVRGITGFKYVGGADSFNQENSCFPNEKIPPGLFNITACKLGMPAFVSFPHFYQADPYYASLVDGMKPDKDKHQMYIVLEPTTGVILEMSIRVQVNMLVRPNPSIPLFNDVPEIYMPILWAEQQVTIPKSYAFLLRVVLAVPITGQICGITTTLIGILILCRLLLRRNKIVGYKNSTKKPVKHSVEAPKLNVDHKEYHLVFQDCDHSKVDS